MGRGSCGGSVRVHVKCGNKGTYLCTLLNYICIIVLKKTLKHSYQKDLMSHLKISSDPCFVQFKSTVYIVPPQQFKYMWFLFTHSVIV